MKGEKNLEHVEISLEKLFDLIRESAKDVGHYDAYGDNLSISLDQKEETSEVLMNTVERFMASEFNSININETEILEEDVFLLSSDDDDDDDDLEDY